MNHRQLKIGVAWLTSVILAMALVLAPAPASAQAGPSNLDELQRRLEEKMAEKRAEQELLEKKRRDAERAARVAREKAAEETRREQARQEQARQEQARQAAAEADRLLREAEAAEAAARAERDRVAAEAARLEQERRDAENAARRAEAARIARENLLAEQKRIEESQHGRAFRDCSDCPEMVRIGAASFQMGDIRGMGEGNESPIHPVKVPAFSIGKMEVTVAQWQVCFSERGCTRKTKASAPNLPATGLNLADIQEYITWLSRKTGKPYRLPSESEWELAARAGTTTNYSWGDKMGKNQSVCAGCGSSWDSGSNAPVGSFPANPWGLHDMHGNAAEWTADCWKDSYDNAPADGSARTDGDCGRRAVRGGSRNSFPYQIRVSARDKQPVDKPSDLIGFRLVRDGY